MMISVPIRTARGQNAREHYMQRARRVKAERLAVGLMLNPHKPPQGLVTVLLRRVSPSNKGLDSDNLVGSMKAPRDQIAQWLGRDDADPSITWLYQQRPGKKGEWAVEIEVEVNHA